MNNIWRLKITYRDQYETDFVEEELFMIVDGKKIFYDTAIVCSKCRNTFKWGTTHEQSTKNNQDI